MKHTASALRPVSLVLCAAILVAAAIACVTFLSGDIGDNDYDVASIGVGFAIYSATAAAGIWALWKAPVTVQWLGRVTLVLATITFVLSIVATSDAASDDLVRWTTCCGVASLGLTHVTLTSAVMHRPDSVMQHGAHVASMLFAVAAAVLGILVITHVISESEDIGKIIASDLVLLIATTVVAALLRRGRRG